jgi:hypothetical protein
MTKTWKYREDFEQWFLLINDVDETLLEKLDDGFYKDGDINLMYGAFHAGLEIGRPPTPAARTTKPPEVDGLYWVKFKNRVFSETVSIIPQFGSDEMVVIRLGTNIFCPYSDIEWRSVEPVTEPEWGPIDG